MKNEKRIQITFWIKLKVEKGISSFDIFLANHSRERERAEKYSTCELVFKLIWADLNGQ